MCIFKAFTYIVFISKLSVFHIIIKHHKFNNNEDLHFLNIPYELSTVFNILVIVNIALI